MLRATALIYSSHNRCAYIHREWIAERALQSHDNKTILYLPMSMQERDQQEYSWNTFRWYFDQFHGWGLHAIPFFWSPSLSKDDVDILFRCLDAYEVVILGGGNSYLGMQRYRELGAKFYANENLFSNMLHERQHKGKLTVGFSAGASQLSEYIWEIMDRRDLDPHAFSLARNVLVNLHQDWNDGETLKQLGMRIPACMVFGLPNDSGIAVDQGYLPSGNFWQVIEFIIDTSWDVVEDGWHIKTRQGMNIQHYYCDGRHWGFNQGDRLVRIVHCGSMSQEAWIFGNGNVLEYWTQQPSGYANIEQILHDH